METIPMMFIEICNVNPMLLSKVESIKSFQRERNLSTIKTKTNYLNNII